MQNYNRIAGMADFGKVAVFFCQEKGPLYHYVALKK
jgi:hypothetical protein